MQVTLLKSKLHMASVTSVRPDYSGSLSIDQTLMEAAGFLHHEKILVGNIANGERFETYCIPADHGSGEIGLNGAAAHKGKAGDLLVIMTLSYYMNGSQKKTINGNVENLQKRRGPNLAKNNPKEKRY